MLRQLEQQLEQQRANLAHVDATMRGFVARTKKLALLVA
jgi:hypothetical protein